MRIQTTAFDPAATSAPLRTNEHAAFLGWFLVGGDFYTAYTVIAVPALVYAVGAYGIFALPV